MSDICTANWKLAVAATLGMHAPIAWKEHMDSLENDEVKPFDADFVSTLAAEAFGEINIKVEPYNVGFPEGAGDEDGVSISLFTAADETSPDNGWLFTIDITKDGFYICEDETRATHSETEPLRLRVNEVFKTAMLLSKTNPAALSGDELFFSSE